jgi:hypothetical protein
MKLNNKGKRLALETDNSYPRVISVDPNPRMTPVANLRAQVRAELITSRQHAERAAMFAHAADCLEDSPDLAASFAATDKAELPPMVDRAEVAEQYLAQLNERAKLGTMDSYAYRAGALSEFVRLMSIENPAIYRELLDRVRRGRAEVK